jgi:hypothetical protein
MSAPWIWLVKGVSALRANSGTQNAVLQVATRGYRSLAVVCLQKLSDEHDGFMENDGT